ncbi:MAG: ribonuclease H-like domain-containing protein [Candidatus Spechtbacterales bacterium]|nr:ribonuclease H-like domain-containing protein [Candidatus Spechtbacterales bacterium]
MSYLVFDIETIGKPYDEFDEKSKEIFKQWAERESHTKEDFDRALETVKEGFPFSPFLGEIISIAVLDQDGKGGVYFQAPDSGIEDFEEENPAGDEPVKYRVGSEKDILDRFWEIARHYNKFVTFAGRLFDGPFVHIRSAVHEIKPTHNLMDNRYLGMQRRAKHVDLADQLSFYGAMRPRPKLHFATQAFGITSPKEGGMEGKDVPKAFKDKKYKEIAEYNFADVVATRELYEKWNTYINI